MDAANPEFPTADVALVLGANDVTNPGRPPPGQPGVGHADPERRPGQEGFSRIPSRLAHRARPIRQYQADTTSTLAGMPPAIRMSMRRLGGPPLITPQPVRNWACQVSFTLHQSALRLDW